MMPDAGSYPVKVLPRQGDAAFCGETWSAPLMEKNGRAAPLHRIWPVPIGEDHKVIKRISAAQFFVAKTMR